MSIAIGGIYQESNAFVTGTTSFANLAEAHLHYGEDRIEQEARVLFANPAPVAAAIAAGVGDCETRGPSQVRQLSWRASRIQRRCPHHQRRHFLQHRPNKEWLARRYTSGVLVVMTERRMPMWNIQQLRALGIEPTRLGA